MKPSRTAAAPRTALRLVLGLVALAAAGTVLADPPHRFHHHGGVRVVVDPWMPWYAPPSWAHAPRLYLPPVVVTRPPPVYVEQPPMAVAPAQADWWYYCDPAGAYYPYVTECPGGWRQVAPRPPAPPQ